jgi:glycosyltransferase involved in cell wall biosynthesis
MKILHVIFCFPHDGAETMLVDIMNEQSKTDHVELIIINDLYNRDLIQTIDKKVKIHYLNRVPGSINPIKIIEFNFRVFKIQPDVIHFHDHNGIRFALYRGKALTFLTIHGLKFPITNFGKYDKLISISDAVKNDLLSGGSFESIVIYNGIDFSKIAVKSAYNSSGVFKMVDVGRLCHEVKGQDILLKALHYLIYQKGIESVKLDFIGEGPSLKYLQELMYQLKLDQFVNFLGLKDRHFIYNNLANYDLLIQPSISEGFGLTVVEAMAAKIPVVVSNTYGPLEIIRNGQFGDCFDSGDPCSCADVLEKSINKFYDSNFSDFLDKTYDYAISNFSIQNTAQKYLNEYHKTV